MVFDFVKSKTLFKTSAGHTETVFDCCFSPHTPDLFASSSYDSTIKVVLFSLFMLF